MQFFGRKKKEEHQNMPAELPPLSSLDDIMLPPVEQPKAMREPEKPREQSQPTVAPLFVKIERYRQILSTIGNLKTALVVVKNSLNTLDQIEKVRGETFNIVNDIVEKMDQKLVNLDNELLRPAGFHSPETSPDQQDIRSIEATVSELKGQIEQLKSELSKDTI